MSSTMEKVSSNKVKLRLSLDAEAFEPALQSAYLRMRGRIAVPGFRKGKAPRKVIERMYGESTFYEEAFDAVFPGLYSEAIEENNIKAVGQPEINIETINAAEGLVILAEVYVVPEVTLGEYKGLDIQRGDDAVDEDAVDQEIGRVRQRNAREQEINDRPVADDDIVTLDYAGTVDGVAFEGGTAQGHTLTIGSGEFIPGFEEQMLGMNIGEEKDITVTFPEKYHAEDLAGKEAVFHVKVHRIRTRELPEVDDEFAKDVSEFDTIDEYKASIRAKLEAEAARQADNAFENELIEAVVSGAQVDIPPPMLERELDSMMFSMQQRMMYQGLRFEDYLSYTNQTAEQLRDTYRDDAEKRVKADLVLDAIRKAEGIEPTEAEIDTVLAEYAQSQNKELEDYRSELNEQQLEALSEIAAGRMTLQLLKDTAQKAQ